MSLPIDLEESCSVIILQCTSQWHHLILQQHKYRSQCMASDSTPKAESTAVNNHQLIKLVKPEQSTADITMQCLLETMYVSRTC